MDCHEIAALAGAGLRDRDHNHFADDAGYVTDFGDRLHAAMPNVRIPSGVVVLGQSLEVGALSSDLHPGDIIHAVNQVAIQSTEQLRSVLGQIKPDDPLILQIERQGRLQYVDAGME